MNKRIRHFAKQVLSKDQFGMWLGGDEDIQKFAELLIKDCAKFMDTETDGFFPDGNQLLKQFGIEE